MRILVIADYLPYPLIGGDRIRIYNLVRRIAGRHEVALAATLEKPEDAEGVPHLRQFCSRVEVAGFQQRGRLAKVPGLLRYALEGKPPELSLLFSDELVRKIRMLAAAMDFDIVQIEHSHMALYLEALPADGHRKSILEFHNIASQQYKRFSSVQQQPGRKARSWLNSVMMKNWEPRFAEKFDRCAAVSETDRQFLLKANPRLKVAVIPNGVDIEHYRPLPLPPADSIPSLLFIGNMGYPPCADAALYFCREIFPLIRRRIASVELWIVGRDPRPEVLQLAGEGVHVTGRVEDVVPYYRQCAVCVVPLRAGGGTRLKILEAMALGRPTVSTTIGCEGLDVIDGQHLLIADTPEQFAEKTIRLLDDRQLYKSLSIQGRELVEKTYGWDRIAAKLMDVYADMMGQNDPSQGMNAG